LAVTPDGTKVYVTNNGANTVSIIDTVLNKEIASIPVASIPLGIAVTPDGNTVFVANSGSIHPPFPPGIVSVIDTKTNKVTTTIPVGMAPYGVSLTPGGSKLYVMNAGSGTVSVIDTAKKIVTDTIAVGGHSAGFGIFIQPGPKFAGTPHFSNCFGQSVAALAQKYGGLNTAAAALGFPSTAALQNAIRAYCG
jgi:YVTN family beta-propeller protein